MLYLQFPHEERRLQSLHILLLGILQQPGVGHHDRVALGVLVGEQLEERGLAEAAALQSCPPCCHLVLPGCLARDVIHADHVRLQGGHSIVCYGVQRPLRLQAVITRGKQITSQGSVISTALGFSDLSFPYPPT